MKKHKFMRENKLSSIWTVSEKIAFRFFFIYFSFFIILKNNGTYPLIGGYLVLLKNSLNGFISFVGKFCFGIENSSFIERTGSGDTTFDWVFLFVIFIIALIATIVWSLVDSKSKNYNKLLYWLNVAIRFYVGLMLLNYGFAKLFKTQFSFPSVGRLMQTYGSSSPMRLAWTFLGFSYGYNIFMGVAEVLAGLLLFRRTVAIGALITVATTANVMAVNYFYDVPVKITSTHLLLMTLFLLAPNIKRLGQLFFQNKSISIRIINQPNFKNKVLPKILIGVKYICIGISLFGVFQYTFFMFPNYLKKPKIHGTYLVDEFKRNGEELVHFRDSIRWKYFGITNDRYMYIKKMNDEGIYFKHSIDTLKSQIKLSSFRDTTETYLMNYQKTDSTFNFRVVIENDTLTGKGILKTKEDYLLMNRGFHLISDYPFNR